MYLEDLLRSCDKVISEVHMYGVPFVTHVRTYVCMLGWILHGHILYMFMYVGLSSF